MTSWKITFDILADISHIEMSVLIVSCRIAVINLRLLKKGKQKYILAIRFIKCKRCQKFYISLSTKSLKPCKLSDELSLGPKEAKWSVLWGSELFNFLIWSLFNFLAITIGPIVIVEKFKMSKVN